MAALNAHLKAQAQAKEVLSPLLRQQPLNGHQCLVSLSSLRLRRRIQIAASNSIRVPHFRDVRTRMQLLERMAQGFLIRTVPVQVAHELLNAGHHYLDVRTAEEFAAGHIEGAVNVPYMYKVGSGLSKNLNFVEEVSERFSIDDEVVVGCQLGKRSQIAVAELVAAGFTGVTDMDGGYMAWMQSGMPIKAA